MQHTTESAIDVSTLLTVRDAERVARTMLPKLALDYYRSGADAEITRRANRSAFRKWAIAYHVLVDVSRIDARVRVLGNELASPILVAPMAYQCLAHPEGERATARAAGKSETLYVTSTMATTSLEDVAREYDAASSGAGQRWFQLYVHRDRGLTRSLVERAEANGYGALMLTVDTPVLGRRLRDVRNAFKLPTGMFAANFLPAGDISKAGVDAQAAYTSGRHEPAFSWRDLAWLRSLTRMPLVLKGVVRGDDALRAVDAGASGVIVSNHGGRQLDGAVANLDALPGVVEAVASRGPSDFTVLMDGGIRWGTDVLKALALGAKAIFVGRPILWGLTVGGEAGAARVLEILRNELATAMALAGCPDVATITRDMVVRS